MPFDVRDVHSALVPLREPFGETGAEGGRSPALAPLSAAALAGVMGAAPGSAKPRPRSGCQACGGRLKRGRCRRCAEREWEVVLPFEAYVSWAAARVAESAREPKRSEGLGGVLERWVAWLLLQYPDCDVDAYGRRVRRLGWSSRGLWMALEALSPGAGKVSLRRVGDNFRGEPLVVAYGALAFSPSRVRLWRQRRLYADGPTLPPSGSWTACEIYDAETDSASCWRALWAYFLYEELKRRGVRGSKPPTPLPPPRKR